MDRRLPPSTRVRSHSRLLPLAGERERVAEILRTRLPWSPHDFLPGLSAAGDRALTTGHWLRALDDSDDLRFIYRSAAGDECVVLAERLPWDSQFFGFEVARLHKVFPLTHPENQEDYSEALQLLKRRARAKGIRYLFAGIDPRDLAAIRGLCASGFTLIETRCHYHRDLRDYGHPERYSCRVAGTQDIPSLSRTARTMSNPFDRFHADPFIGAEAAGRLLTTWVEASIVEAYADVTLVPNVAEPAAFCTVKYHRDKWPAWGLKLTQFGLAAVSPEFKGWFLKLVSELNYHAQARGAEHSLLVTQLTNKAVIRVCEKLGYALGRGEHIFRIVL